MKKSRIKRLVPKKTAHQLVEGNQGGAAGLMELFLAEAGPAIARMRSKGFELVTCLDTGEGVFVCEADVVSLHIQLPQPLYQRLADECERREASKRSLVVEALEGLLN